MKFPSLPAASTLDGTEIIPGTQGGVDKRTTAQAIANLFKGTKGADIASAATTSIGAATGMFVHVTGTTTITSFGTGTAGWMRVVRFAGILTLTHNVTSLILPTAANITTAANDIGVFVSEGSSNWRCVGYLRANGMPLTADTDTTLAANSDTKVPTQKAVKAYVDSIVAAQDAMVFKGVIDCSGEPDYPAADRGWTYRVSVAGKIGGASGVIVEQGDILICLTDGSAAGDQAAVGANWSIIQTNIDGSLTTAASLNRPTATLTSTAGIVSIDLADGIEVYTLTLTENVTGWSITPPPAGKTAELRVDVKQGDSVAYSCVSPASVGDHTAGGTWIVSTTLGAGESLGLAIDSSGTVDVYPSGVKG